jgi:two-component system, LytTR family, sensor kinase
MTRIIKHLSFWIVYLLFQSYIEFIWIKSSYANISEVSRFLIALKVELSLIIPKLMFTYGSTIILLSFYSTKQLTELITRLIGLFLLSLILYRVIIIYIILPFIYNEVEKDVYSIIRLLTASIDIIAVSGVFQVIKLYKLQLKSVQNEEQLVKAKLETELSYLKSQTNPHFLFNTLNNIYGLSKKNPSLSSDAILKLSKVLRFMIYGTQKALIPIDEEMELIRNYIEIEQLRYSNKLELTLNYNNQQRTSSITPLILLPFVENAFKHGVAESTANAFILIDCSINQENELHFMVRNSKEVETLVNDSEGIGLKNVKRQLSLLYKKYSLDIVNNETMFEIKLWISLNSYESL